jgi:hypothetical protein
MNSTKIRVEFDGWRYLTREQTEEILADARRNFVNANFFESRGLLIEARDELTVLSFCHEIIKIYQSTFGTWDGFNFSRLSTKIVLQFADKKRKLDFGYFRKLIKDSSLEDIKVVLAGILYLTPDDVLEILMKMQKTIQVNFKEMNDDELQKSYKMILMAACLK